MLSLGLAGAGYWYGYGQYFESTDNAYLQGDITNISPKVSGYIVKSYVSDNQSVKAGDLLVQIDDRDYQSALAQASAHLSVVQSDVKTLQHNRRYNVAKLIKQRAASILHKLNTNVRLNKWFVLVAY